jgi:exopolyphosphatase/guanosine-5'-triphosphate,3'-diphosphate pyrophosphatase
MVHSARLSSFATSAMREAHNAREVVELIQEKANIKIEIIDGKKRGSHYSSLQIKSFVKIRSHLSLLM